MRAPLTPDIAVQVLPVPFAADLTKASIRSQPTKASLARIGSFLAVPSNSSFLGKHLLLSSLRKILESQHPRILTIESLMDDWKQAL